MGRNDICFCGSGKKVKKCHPDITENSLAAKIIKSHNTIDKTISNYQESGKKNSKCHTGCSECCYDYFLITDCEFYIILNEVNKWDDDEKQQLTNKVQYYMDIFKTEHPDILNYLNKGQTGSQDMFLEINNLITKTSFPCIFLEEETQKCKIYELRPTACRILGNIMQVTNNKQFDYETQNSVICSNIGAYKDADWLVDIEFTTGNEHDYKNIPIDSDKFITIKQYPLFYHLYHNLFVEQLNFKIPSNLAPLFFAISEDEYVKRLKHQLGIK